MRLKLNKSYIYKDFCITSHLLKFLGKYLLNRLGYQTSYDRN